MANTEKSVRQSVSIPARIAKRVKALAKTEKTSASRVLVDLIEAGLASKEAEKHFRPLAGGVCSEEKTDLESDRSRWRDASLRKHHQSPGFRTC